MFQTPFGITACESVGVDGDADTSRKRFKLLSASLHVKEEVVSDREVSGTFQTPFGITACERVPTVFSANKLGVVSNAFRHHCM